jgi:hypothetical protein
MIAKSILVGVAMTCASAAHAVDGAPQQDKIVRLACAGTLIAGEDSLTGSPIAASGTIDFIKMQVRGFGLGSAPIVFTSAAEVRFGTSPLVEPKGAQTIEGAIDRVTGKTSIVVRSTREPALRLIAMTLDCRLTPPIS